MFEVDISSSLTMTDMASMMKNSNASDAEKALTQLRQ